MGDYSKKERADLDEQTNRITSEAKRREAEIRSKKAGIKLENLELDRKRKEIASIRDRIDFNYNFIKAFINFTSKDLKSYAEEMKNQESFHYKKFKELFNQYLSVRKDLSNIFKDSKINEFFPLINFPKDIIDIDICLHVILRQETDLLLYLKRFY